MNNVTVDLSDILAEMREYATAYKSMTAKTKVKAVIHYNYSGTQTFVGTMATLGKRAASPRVKSFDVTDVLAR